MCTLFSGYCEIVCVYDFILFPAGLSFFPCGVFMGYIINYYPLDEYMTKNYEKVKFWPLLVGILFSFITCGIINGVKIAYKQYKFIQFYFIYFGMILFYLSGILITKEGNLNNGK